MTDTEFVPIAELEVEMTVGELLAALPKTCPDCCGSGYGGHPDSGATCCRCGGSGGIAADTVDRLTKERDEARRLVGLARRLAGAVQRFRNLPGLERSKLRETPEYHDLCERWRVFQEADSAALKEGGADAAG